MTKTVAGALALAACAPALPPGVPAVAQAHYRCTGGRSLDVRFDNRGGTAIVFLGRRHIRLREKRTASGIWYAGGGYDLRGKGRLATWREKAGHADDCVSAWQQ